jgi:hypothetical protein
MKMIFGLEMAISNYNIMKISCLRYNWVKILKKDEKDDQKIIQTTSFLEIQQDNLQISH